jgi:predicted component of type VI protein secretion system
VEEQQELALGWAHYKATHDGMKQKTTKDHFKRKRIQEKADHFVSKANQNKKQNKRQKIVGFHDTVASLELKAYSSIKMLHGHLPDLQVELSWRGFEVEEILYQMVEKQAKDGSIKMVPK